MSEYGALVEKAREWDGGETTAVFGVLDSLADAVEALVAEKLKAEWSAWEAIKHRAEGDNRYRIMREERDALLSVLNEKDDAPLWRRIAHQRFQLGHLNRAQFQHVVELRNVKTWFRDRIAADGGQARKELAQVAAERDALRAQIDSMTTEWETVSGDDPPIRTHNWKSGEMEHLRSYAETSGSKILKRLVGPWAEVTDE